MFSFFYSGSVANLIRMNDCDGRYSDTNCDGLKISYDRHGTTPGVRALDRQNCIQHIDLLNGTCLEEAAPYKHSLFILRLEAVHADNWPTVSTNRDHRDLFCLPFSYAVLRKGCAALPREGSPCLDRSFRF
jgi:hypothetical protein